jgi:delta 1-pyrroline-5-carboxylate dehydrogenase
MRFSSGRALRDQPAHAVTFFGMSGVGTKAGGLDYLLHFVEPRCSAENTMRRGFAPEL